MKKDNVITMIRNLTDIDDLDAVKNAAEAQKEILAKRKREIRKGTRVRINSGQLGRIYLIESVTEGGYMITIDGGQKMRISNRSIIEIVKEENLE